LRSAASAYYQGDLAAAPHRLRSVTSRLGARQISPTDSLHFTMQRGKAWRVAWATPANLVGLSNVHIAYIDTHLNQAFMASTNPRNDMGLAVAPPSTYGAYLGWLIGGETFSKRDEVDVISPPDGPHPGYTFGGGGRYWHTSPRNEIGSRAADTSLSPPYARLILGLWMSTCHIFGPVKCSCLHGTETRLDKYFRRRMLGRSEQLVSQWGPLRGFSTVPGHRIRTRSMACIPGAVVAIASLSRSF
jgi:hypothetical protein